MVPLAKQISGECRGMECTPGMRSQGGEKTPWPPSGGHGVQGSSPRGVEAGPDHHPRPVTTWGFDMPAMPVFFLQFVPFFGTNPKLSSFGLCWAKAGAAVLSQQPCPECLGAKRGPWAAGSRKLRKLQDLSMTGSWTNRTSSVGELSLTRKCDGYSWFIFSPVGWLNISWSYQGFGGISAGQLGMRCRGPQRGR